MHSKRLEAHGLINKIAGKGYNFRYQIKGDSVAGDVNRVLDELNITPKELYSGQQKHTGNIAYVDGSNGEAFIYGKRVKETDGLITDKKQIALLIKFADCTPIILYDPVKGVQASVHSGWRGTQKRISLHAIKKMESEFHCKRENILVYLGPSIDQANYEVGPEVYEAFKGFPRRETFFKSHGETYWLDMLEANLSIIQEAGIPKENIDIERTSTFMDSRLHSARAEGTAYQLNAIVTYMP